MNKSAFPLPAASTLPVRFVIYLPSEPETSEADPQKLEAAVVRILCERFGGVTAYPARGTFKLASGAVKTEAVTVLEAYCNRETWSQDSEGAGKLVRLIGRLLNQEAIGCSIDGKMILIDAAADAPSALLKSNPSTDLYAVLCGAFT